MSQYVYRNTEPGLYTVGFYHPNGAWEPESDHTSAEKAIEKVNYLNRNFPIPVPGRAEFMLAMNALQRITDVTPSDKELEPPIQGMETRMYARAFGQCQGIAKDALARLHVRMDKVK